MPHDTHELRRFLGEDVPLKRWKLYSLRFGFLALAYLAIMSVLDTTGHSMFATVGRTTSFALFMSAWFVWFERRSKATSIVLIAALLVSVLMLFLVIHGAKVSR